jgi:hypothetical protein
MQVDWLEILYKVFEVALIPLIAAATAYLITLINAKKKELVEKTKNETIKKYIEMLDKTIVDCVVATNQTYVEALKKEGKFDANAQKIAFTKTYTNVMAILNKDAKKYLEEAIGDLETYVYNKIEAEVNLTK